MKPVASTDAESETAHEPLLEKAEKGKSDLYFVGHSIISRWGATDYPEFLADWKENFRGWNAAIFGWGGAPSRTSSGGSATANWTGWTRR